MERKRKLKSIEYLDFKRRSAKSGDAKAAVPMACSPGNARILANEAIAEAIK
jgi:hypothetical protein